MQVICIKLIYPNFPGSIEGVQRKMISISQHDQVVTISSHFAIGKIVTEQGYSHCLEEMGGFMAYKTPDTSHSRSQSILPREVVLSIWEAVGLNFQQLNQHTELLSSAWSQIFQQVQSNSFQMDKTTSLGQD